jgi:peptidoglycan hydrolase CwlO-like protein
MFKNLDIKTIAIIVLAAGLILSFIFGQHGSKIDNHEDEISALHKDNEALLHKNDSLNSLNTKINEEIVLISKKITADSLELVITKKELYKLNNRQNEIHNYVKSLSANGVSSSFSDYLNNKSKKLR